MNKELKWTPQGPLISACERPVGCRSPARANSANRASVDTPLRHHMVIKSNGSAAVALDQEFADAVGEKERRLSALLNHEREHRCA